MEPALFGYLALLVTDGKSLLESQALDVPQLLAPEMGEVELRACLKSRRSGWSRSVYKGGNDRSKGFSTDLAEAEGVVWEPFLPERSLADSGSLRQPELFRQALKYAESALSDPDIDTLYAGVFSCDLLNRIYFGNWSFLK